MAAIWELHKDRLYTLYITRNESLRKIMVHMEDDHGFARNKGQYERQFKKWNFRKNSKADCWDVLSRKIELRRTQGKGTVVRRDGEEVSQQKLNKERRYAPLSALEFVQYEKIASTPEGFTVCTPRYDAMPRISMNNLPSLRLFGLLPLHIDPLNVLIGHSNQDLASRMARYDSKRNSKSTSALVQCADWVQPLTGDRYSYLDNGSDGTAFEIDVLLELSSISRAGENSRLLLSIIHSAANNLLSGSEASEVLSVVLQTSNRKIFQALIAGQSPATKAIARTFLPDAIDSLDCPLVRALLDTGVNPNSYVGEGRRRLLSIAIAKQSMELTQLLLDRGADVNMYFVTYHPNHANTPLKVAIRTGRLDLVQLLLQAGAHVNMCQLGQGSPALISAVRTGQLELVQVLLDAGADVHAAGNPYGLTALHTAAGAGNIEIVQLLLSYGADVNATCGEFRCTALEFAARSGNVEIIQLLLYHGATDAVSALRTAGNLRSNHVVSHLVCFEMRSHAILDDAFGQTALQAATHCGDFDLVRALLDCGVRTDALPTDGATSCQTALQIASHHGDIKIAELLLVYGADINASAFGTAAAHQASRRRDYMELYGVEPPGINPSTYRPSTALQAAVCNNHMQLVQVLLNHGADVNAPATDTGKTALVTAAQQGNAEILQLLLDFGADVNTRNASVVIEAIGRVSLAFLQFLLDTWTHHSGSNLDWTFDKDSGYTALERAAQTCDIGTIRFLLAYESGDKSLALREAVNHGAGMEVVKLFLASGAEIGYLDVDGKCGHESQTVLDVVAGGAHLETLRLLLEHRTGLTGDEKSQALQVAVHWCKLDAARLLLANGADVNAAPLAFIGDARKTALQIAASNSNLEMVRFLLEAGAYVESKTFPGDEQALAFPEEATALQFAAIAGSMSVVTALIQKGADVFAPAIGEYGRSALEGAAEHGRLDVVQLLLNLGVEVTGSRAIQFARKEGHDGVVALLEASS